MIAIGVALSKDVYSYKSSANNLKCASLVSRSLINRIKGIGHRTGPWSTPLINAEGLFISILVRTTNDYRRIVQYKVLVRNRVSEMAKQFVTKICPFGVY